MTQNKIGRTQSWLDNNMMNIIFQCRYLCPTWARFRCVTVLRRHLSRNRPIEGICHAFGWELRLTRKLSNTGEHRQGDRIQLPGKRSLRLSLSLGNDRHWFRHRQKDRWINLVDCTYEAVEAVALNVHGLDHGGGFLGESSDGLGGGLEDRLSGAIQSKGRRSGREDGDQGKRSDLHGAN